MRGRGKVRDVTIIKVLLGAFGILLCAGVLLGFGGRLHPAGDTLSLVRLPLGVACLLAALAFRGKVLRTGLLICAGLAAVTTLPMFLDGKGGGEVTLYSKNIWYANNALEELAADIVASGADVVTLQEVSVRNDRLLGLLQDTYPAQHLCRFSSWSGVAVLSRTPIASTDCSSRRAAAAAEITVDGASVWAVAVHIPWPFPYQHEQATQSARALLERLDGPVVIGGDFNIFPWSSSVRQIVKSTGTQIARPLRPTYQLRGVPLFLDHAYAPGGGNVSYRPLLGSDHAGVLAKLHLFR